MHSRPVPKKAVARATKKVAASNKKRSTTKTTKRKFATTAATNDPRFSTINADIDRTFQTQTMPRTRLAKLDSGLRVVSEESPGGLTTVALTIEAGSRFEDESNNGVAKVVANSLFHGNDKLNKKQFRTAFENMGGSFNAKVGREQTVITATVQNEYTVDAIKLLGNVFKKPKLTTEVIDIEKHAAISYLDEMQSDLEKVIDDRLHEAAYRYSTLSLSPSGHVNTLKNLTSEQAQQFHNSHYIAPRTVLSIVGGNIDHGLVADAAADAFAHLPSEATNGIKAKKPIANFIASDIRLRDDEMPRVHFSFGFNTAGYEDVDTYTLMALGHIIGNSNTFNSVEDSYASSEFVLTITMNNLANSTTVFNQQYSDNGLFGIYSVASPVTLDNLGDLKLRALVRHATHVPEQAVVEAKSKMKAQLLGYQTTEQSAEAIGRQILQYNRRIDPVEVLQRIDAIDQTAVQNVVKRFIVDQDFAVSAQGNTFELQDYAPLRKKTYLPWM